MSSYISNLEKITKLENENILKQPTNKQPTPVFKETHDVIPPNNETQFFSDVLHNTQPTIDTTTKFKKSLFSNIQQEAAAEQIMSELNVETAINRLLNDGRIESANDVAEMMLGRSLTQSEINNRSITTKHPRPQRYTRRDVGTQSDYGHGPSRSTKEAGNFYITPRTSPAATTISIQTDDNHDDTDIDDISSQMGNISLGSGLQMTKRGRTINYGRDNAKFGKWLICKNRLKDNIASFQSANRQAISDMRNTDISDPMRRILLALADNNEPDMNDLQELDDIAEKPWLQRVLSRSNHKMKKLPKTLYGGELKEHKCVCSSGDSTYQMKVRLQILLGEKNAENDNPALTAELKDLVSRMLQRKLLTQQQATAIVKNYT